MSEYVGVPDPQATLAALQSTCAALKANVDTLTRQRGTSIGWSATVAELTQEIGDNNGAGAEPVSVAYLRNLAAEASMLVTSVSQQLGSMLKRSGDGMSGPLTLSGEPTEPGHAAPKSYVDKATKTTWADMPGRPEAFPPKPHRHPIGEIDNLENILENLSLADHEHDYRDLRPAVGEALTTGHVLTWTEAGFAVMPPPAPSGGGGAGLWIGSSSPLTPGVTPFWFDTNVGELLIYFNDGNSTQWVPVAPARIGPPGPAGNTTLSGPREPLPADGRDGDFWINHAEFVIYGPKVAGQWPVGVSMRTGGRTLTMAGERVLMSGFNVEMR